MDLTLKDWIEIFGVVVLPIIGFVFSLLLSGLRTQLKELQKVDDEIDRKLDDFKKETQSWYAQIPEKYARRDELEKNFQQLYNLIDRLDKKLERLLERGVPPLV